MAENLLKIKARALHWQTNPVDWSSPVSPMSKGHLKEVKNG
jgi:hypothetical protein